MFCGLFASFVYHLWLLLLLGVIIRLNKFAEIVGCAWEDTIVEFVSCTTMMWVRSIFMSLNWQILVQIIVWIVHILFQNFQSETGADSIITLNLQTSKEQYHCDGCGICRYINHYSGSTVPFSITIGERKTKHSLVCLELYVDMTW